MKKFLKINVTQNGQPVTLWLSLDLVGSVEKSGNMHVLKTITGATLMITPEDYVSFCETQLESGRRVLQ